MLLLLLPLLRWQGCDGVVGGQGRGWQGGRGAGVDMGGRVAGGWVWLRVAGWQGGGCGCGWQGGRGAGVDMGGRGAGGWTGTSRHDNRALTYMKLNDKSLTVRGLTYMKLNDESWPMTHCLR